MIKNLKSISEGNEKYVSNEERIADQKLSIEVWDRDIYQKKRVNMDVQAEIQNALNEIDKIERLIAQRCSQIEQLEKELEDAKAELKEFQDDLEAANQRILELQNYIANLADEKARLEIEEAERRRLQDTQVVKEKPPATKVKYAPIKGDKVDEKMAMYINNFELDIPIQRIGDGQYMFGSRKIFAKIMNEKLVIRVGGGYMLIDEFLATYGQQELDKLNEKLANSNNPNGNANFSAVGMGSPTRKGSVGSRPVGMAGRMSPNASRASPNMRGSPTANNQRMKF